VQVFELTGTVKVIPPFLAEKRVMMQTVILVQNKCCVTKDYYKGNGISGSVIYHNHILSVSVPVMANKNSPSLPFS
jgi:hypothetical protein